MDEPFISRLMFFHTHVLQNIGMKDNEVDWENTRKGLWAVLFEGLVPAFNTLETLRKTWDDPKVPEIDKEQMAWSVFGSLTIAFKDRFQITVSRMGYNIGFLFQKDDEFKKGGDVFKAEHPDVPPEFIGYLQRVRSSGWWRVLNAVRNRLIEHQSKKTEQELEDLQGFVSLEVVEKLFEVCWQTIEEILLVLVLDRIDPNYAMELLEAQEYEENKNCSERISWGWKPGRKPVDSSRPS